MAALNILGSTSPLVPEAASLGVSSRVKFWCVDLWIRLAAVSHDPLGAIFRQAGEPNVPGVRIFGRSDGRHLPVV